MKLEMVTSGSRFGMWIDGQRMREEDLAVARDLGKLGASVMVIGQNLRDDAGQLVLEIPATPDGWQFLFDIIPAQLAAERLATLSGVDCDSFRICSYIVQSEYGLLTEPATTHGSKEAPGFRKNKKSKNNRSKGLSKI